MWVYLITADIKNEANRPGFNKAVEDLSTQGRKTGLTTVWFVQSPYSAKALLNALKPHAGSEDQILVIEVAKDFDTFNLAQTNDWLKAHFPA